MSRDSRELAVRRVARALAAAEDVSEALQVVVENAIASTAAFGGYMEQVVGDEVLVSAALGEGVPPPGTRAAYPGSLTQAIVDAGEAMLMTDVGTLGAAMVPHLGSTCHQCSALLVPMVAQGRALGALVLLKQAGAGSFDDEDVAHAVVLGDLAATAFKRIVVAVEREAHRERLSAVMESTEEGLYGIDAVGVCTFVNRAASRMLGYAPEELLGKRIHALIHHTRADGTPYPEEECSAIAAARTGQLVRVAEDVLWRRDGAALPVTYSAAPARAAMGLTGSVIAFTDMTEARKASESVRLSEQRLRALTHTAVAAILIVDESDTITFVNPACEQLFGYEAGDLVGRPLTLLIPERFQSRHRSGVENYRRTGLARIPWHGVHLSGKHREGHEIPLEVTLGHFLQDGKHFFTGIARDISERTRAEAERERLLAMEREARSLAEAALRARDEVLAIVSHDLRNPLNSILLALEVLPQTVGTPAMFQKQTTMMKRAGQRMNRLIQDLLDLARLEAGQALGMSPAPLEVGALLGELQEALQPQAEAKQQQLVVVADTAAPEVFGDHDRLLQVLTNLVGNAVKFTPEGGRVSVVSAARGTHVEFSVSDTGSGIPAEDLGRVFDRYWQTQRTARLGAGLGLPICKGIVEASGGRLWVESTPGLGSTFRFTVPVQPDPSSAGSAEPQP